MMSQLSQFDGRAVYDAHRGVLQVSGSTHRRQGAPPPVTIHVAVKQLTPEGSFSEAREAAVPRRRLPDRTWETRITGDFVPGTATAFGVSLEFAHDPGAFETSVWARTITIEAGALPDDSASS
jgi:hypothetical protein